MTAPPVAPYVVAPYVAPGFVELPRGLPAHLPEGERLLWQGAPDWRAMARHVFRFRLLTAYLAAVLTWSLLSVGGTPMEVALQVAQILGAVAVPPLLVVVYSWLAARTTVYTVTDARVVVRLGIAFPMTLNLPYNRIETAALKLQADGSGDISLLLGSKDKLAYTVLWPHARPRRMKRVEPTLRAVADAARVGQVLARAMAASANMPVPAMVEHPAPQAQPAAVPA